MESSFTNPETMTGCEAIECRASDFEKRYRLEDGVVLRTVIMLSSSVTKLIRHHS
ncbi:MAG: hypothetical protein IPN42_16575 [Methylococcaceae bacterium]|nr:hypothetical protein [Methylococcaceae bacterium]